MPPPHGFVAAETGWGGDVDFGDLIDETEVLGAALLQE